MTRRRCRAGAQVRDALIEGPADVHEEEDAVSVSLVDAFDELAVEAGPFRQHVGPS